MRVSAFITDLDGTLNIFKIDIIKIWREITEYLESVGMLSYFINIYSVTEFFRTIYELGNKIDRERFIELRNRVYSIACKYEYEASLNTVAKPYAAELLDYINKQGVKMGVVSNSCKKAVYYSLNKLGFTNFFDVIVSREDVDRIKPHPDPIFKVLRLLGCESKTAIYLGDSSFDVAAGKLAGVTTIYLDDREVNYSRDLNEKPDYMIKSLKEFLLLWETSFL